MAVNVLWPIVPVAIAMHFKRPTMHLTVFIFNYLAMIPAASLIAFAGQELARKLPTIAGIVVETLCGSIVEIVMLMVLLKTSNGDSNLPVIKAAILGSILANMLLCLGACFIAGGLKHNEQTFDQAISEAGSALMLVACMGFILPTVFANTLANNAEIKDLAYITLKLSRGTAIILLFAYIVFMWFQTKTHNSLFREIYQHEELRDEARHRNLAKAKLTLTECVIALVMGIACLASTTVFLDLQIPYIVKERYISNAFVGLILIPVVEKLAEHLISVQGAYNNQMSFALTNTLGASIQTALLNTPLVIIVGWGLDIGMDMNFHMFDVVYLILAVLVVGMFLRDGKTNYLEGVLCVLMYIIIAISAYYFPNSPRNG